MEWLTNWLFGTTGKGKSGKERFDLIYDFARLTMAQNPQNLHALVYLLGKPTQSSQISYMLSSRDDKNYEGVTAGNFFFDAFKEISEGGITLNGLKKEVDENHVLKLGQDLIYPNPWNRRRLIKCMGFIGAPENPWEHDPTNHRVDLWWPFDIGWVRGGNHSIAVGVIKQEGEVPVQHVYDVSSVFDYVYCDGEYYLNKNSGAEIEPVRDINRAAIFEIGRMIADSSSA